MDQRRFIAFLILCVTALWLSERLFPRPQKPPQPPPAAGAQADKKELPAEAVAADGKAKDDKPADATQPAAPEGAQPPAPLPQVAAVAAVAEPMRYVTLGSLDSESGYRMLVTMTSTGASVRRAEMSSRRFLDQHDWSGYMGELELVTADGGAKVQVVGDGTPAQKAGIEAGDVIVGIKASAETAIHTAGELIAVLAKTDPRQEITLLVKRGDAAPEPHDVKLVRRPFAVLRPEIDNYRMRKADPPPDFVDVPSFLLSLHGIDGRPLEEADAKRLADILEKGNWEVAGQDANSVTFRRTLAELNLEVSKRYTLQPVPEGSRGDVNYPEYHLKLDVEVRNTGDTPQTGVSYRLDGPTGMPLEGWWYSHKISQRWFAAAGLRDIVVRFAGSQSVQLDCPQIAEGKVAPMGQGAALAYAGVDGVYFSAIMIPIKKSLEEVWFKTTEAVVVGPKPDARTPATYTNVTCRMFREPVKLAAGATHTDSFQVFIGPKRPDLLAQYKASGDPNYSLRDVIYYGWPIFGAVAKAMLWVLHTFYGFVGNYGIAIIMLTVVVRGALFPLSYKQTKSMARMQALKPEIDRISEKFKTDVQKKSAAIQELYRKNKINPLGGCLPVFLQLPIFIGLYRALAVDVELRQSPLFSSAIRWCSNLAAPDMLWDWSAIMPEFVTSGIELMGLGPYLNVLPLVTVGLFLVTQKMAMPAPDSEQAVMQQKMMKYMTAFMGVLFYKVASGLCLYFIASSLWGIAERKLLPKKQSLDDTATDSGAGSTFASAGKRSGNGSPRTGQNGSSGSKPPKAKRKK